MQEISGLFAYVLGNEAAAESWNEGERTLTDTLGEWIWLIQVITFKSRCVQHSLRRGSTRKERNLEHRWSSMVYLAGTVRVLRSDGI